VTTAHLAVRETELGADRLDRDGEQLAVQELDRDRRHEQHDDPAHVARRVVGRIHRGVPGDFVRLRLTARFAC
jgi:hypothetical protein